MLAGSCKIGANEFRGTSMRMEIMKYVFTIEQGVVECLTQD